MANKTKHSGNTDTGILREIDEELRQEHYSKLWKRYGNGIIAAVVLLIVGVAGYKGWQSYDHSKRSEAGIQMAQAISLSDQGNIEEAFAAFNAIANDSPQGYQVLAGLLNSQGDGQAASLAYQEISSDSAVQKEFRDLAVLLEVTSVIDLENPESLLGKLAPLSVMDNPWHHSALEARALLEIRQGNKQAAIETLTQLSTDQTTPSGISARAGEMISALNAQ